MVKKNICKTSDYCDNTEHPSMHFKASCSCIGTDHVQHIILEIERNIPCALIATFYYECVISDWYTSLWKRLKMSLKVLWGSKVVVDGDFIFDEESLKDYIDTLSEARQKLIDLRDKKNLQK